MSTSTTIATARAATSLTESYRLCCELARSVARNFYYAFRVLPTEKRTAMCALYAFFRRTDDLGDEPGSKEQKRAALAAWRAELRRALSNTAAAAESSDPLLPAIADTVRRYSIPHEYFETAIDGVETDLKRTTFATYAELEDYCYQVASVVGLASIHVWGFDAKPAAYEAARKCGYAFQLTNIVRDIVEDANLGRTYLPLEALTRHGVAIAELREPRLGDRAARERRRALVREVAERAEGYYRDAAALVPYLSRDGRAIYAAMREIYHALLIKIRRRDYDVFAGRVRLTGWRKTWIALKHMGPKLLPFRFGS